MRFKNDVWEFHLALLGAQNSAAFYCPSVEAITDICQDLAAGEDEMAMETIMAIVSADIPLELLERAYELARWLWRDDTPEEARAYVDGWLHWDRASGKPPPYWT